MSACGDKACEGVYSCEKIILICKNYFLYSCHDSRLMNLISNILYYDKRHTDRHPDIRIARSKKKTNVEYKIQSVTSPFIRIEGKSV